MRRWMIAAIIAVVTTLAAVSHAQENKKGVVGTWRVVEADNESLRQIQGISNWRVVFTDDSIIWRNPPPGLPNPLDLHASVRQFRASYSLNNAAIDEITLDHEVGINSDVTALGIYKLEGRKLSICISIDGALPRPKGFDVAHRRGYLTLLLEKIDDKPAPWAPPR